MSYVRDIVSSKRTPGSFATEVVLSCGHEAVLFGDVEHLVRLYGRLASQCVECLKEDLRRADGKEEAVEPPPSHKYFYALRRLPGKIIFLRR